MRTNNEISQSPPGETLKPIHLEPELQLGKRLGNGAFGVVYEATFQGITVAVKHFINAEQLAFKNQEVVILKSLPSHQGLLEYVAEFDDGFAMSFAEGSNLKVHLATDIQFSLPKLLQISCQYINAMQAMHKVGVIHCDLKPANTLYNGREIKICDYGLALTKKQAKKTRDIRGSKCYIAPEIFNFAGPSEASDIYSLGMIFWSLLAGKEPLYLKQLSLDEIGERVQRKHRPPFEDSDYCPVYALIIMRLWAQQPEDRMDLLCASELLNQLSSVDHATLTEKSYVTQIQRFSIFRNVQLALWKALKDQNYFLIDRILSDPNFDPMMLHAKVKSDNVKQAILLTALRRGEEAVVLKFIQHPKATADLCLLHDDLNVSGLLMEAIAFGAHKIVETLLRRADFTKEIFNLLFNNPYKYKSKPMHWTNLAVIDPNRLRQELSEGQRFSLEWVLKHKYFSKSHYQVLLAINPHGKELPQQSVLWTSLIHRIWTELEFLNNKVAYRFRYYFDDITAKEMCEKIIAETPIEYPDTTTKESLNDALTSLKKNARDYLNAYAIDQSLVYAEELKPIQPMSLPIQF